ncbi:MAG: hypothetical protein PHH06_01555 [Candidatus Gracilibacteria bacterium]|nr:hypothetical protein [Candidatus Gracilibacteria bacterium]
MRHIRTVREMTNTELEHRIAVNNILSVRFEVGGKVKRFLEMTLEERVTLLDNPDYLQVFVNAERLAQQIIEENDSSKKSIH